MNNCAWCSDSYHSDNLMRCKLCRADVCPCCFGRLRGHCSQCSPDQIQDNARVKSPESP